MVLFEAMLWVLWQQREQGKAKDFALSCVAKNTQQTVPQTMVDLAKEITHFLRPKQCMLRAKLVA